MFNEFPYTNYEKINLDWLLDLGNKLKADAESGAFDGERGHGIFGITTIYSENNQYYAFNPGGVTVGDFILGYGPAAGTSILYIMKVTSVTGNYVNGTSITQITGPQGEQGLQGPSGYSPTVTVTDITGGHRVTITDLNGNHTFDVMNGTGGGGSVTVDNALSGSSTNPVQNKVIKTALDAKGTYSKPSGGIPKSDLASAVQTSLGKADSALQSVPSTYRTAEAQDTIDAGKIDKPSNPSTGAFLVWSGTAWVAQTLATWQGGSY